MPEARPPVGAPDLAAVVVVEIADDAESPVGMRLDEVAELGGLLTRPHQQHGAEIQAPRAHPPREEAQEDLLGAEEREVDDAEHRPGRTG